MKAYKASNGKIQYMPSAADIEASNGDYIGYCLACGYEQEGVEPDAAKYRCEECGVDKVYGGEYLMVVGLCY